MGVNFLCCCALAIVCQKNQVTKFILVSPLTQRNQRAI